MKSKRDDIGWKVPDKDTIAHKLYLSDFLREPLICSAIQALKIPAGSRGLDTGCGIGSHTALLAEAVGPDGHVTGIDSSSEFLTYAKRFAEKSGISSQIFFQEGNVNKLPFDNDTFDWVWSVDCAGTIPAQPLLLLKELARVVKPGGSVAILAWSSQQLLPGYPRLEARLNATSQGIAPFTTGKKPESHFLRALGWLREAGLQEPIAQTFVGNIQAPLSDDIRSALISLFDMRWGEPRSELSQEDWAEYQRLCQPESPDLILNVPDYYAFFTYSMFHGKVVK